MLSPSAPQESAPGSSPESASVGADVPVLLQANPESPIPQVHPGDATDVTTLAELFVVGGADAEESVELVEPTSFTDGAGAEESVELVESSGNNKADGVRPSLVEPVASDGAGAEQSV